MINVGILIFIYRETVDLTPYNEELYNRQFKLFSHVCSHFSSLVVEASFLVEHLAA